MYLGRRFRVVSDCRTHLLRWGWMGRQRPVSERVRLMRRSHWLNCCPRPPRSRKHFLGLANRCPRWPAECWQRHPVPQSSPRSSLSKRPGSG